LCKAAEPTPESVIHTAPSEEKSLTMSELYLIAAIVFEVAGTTALKLSNGFSRLLPSLFMALFYGLSFTLFSLALKKIDVGIGYATWAALGTGAIAVIGIIWFKEPLTLIKIISLLLIILGVIGMNLGGKIH
jgi:small multidrug resistance pump